MFFLSFFWRGDPQGAPGCSIFSSWLGRLSAFLCFLLVLGWIWLAKRGLYVLVCMRGDPQGAPAFL